MKLLRLTLLGALALLFASTALAGTKGTNLFAIQVANGTADLYSQNDDHFISAFDHSEIGLQAQMWHFLSPDYAMTVSAGFGYFGETDSPGNNAPASEQDFKYTQSSWNVRVGGDRVVSVGDRALVYFGPGVQYWTGKSKFDYGTGAGSIYNWESTNVTRFSLSGRIGAIMNLSRSVGLGCQLGREVGLASATDMGRKASWWPSSFDAAGGIVFGLGK